MEWENLSNEAKFEGAYIKPEDKTYRQISLSDLELIRHNNNWIQRTGA